MEVGDYFRAAMEQLRSERDDITEVRGVGLMVAIELNRQDARASVERCLRKGLIVNPVGDSIIRFLPPLIVRREHVDAAVRIVDEALTESAAI